MHIMHHPCACASMTPHNITRRDTAPQTMPAVHHQHVDFSPQPLDLSSAVAAPADPAAGMVVALGLCSSQCSRRARRRNASQADHVLPQHNNACFEYLYWLTSLYSTGCPGQPTSRQLPGNNQLIGWREKLNGYSTDLELAGTAALLPNSWTKRQPLRASWCSAARLSGQDPAGRGEPYKTEMMDRLAAASLGCEVGRCRW